jgi:predicted phosphodiesterase
LGSGELLAVSDLHVEHEENRKAVERLRPSSPADWLLVAGDVANDPKRVEWALEVLGERFERVVWVPGNHELHASRDDPSALRGESRYMHLVALCRRLGVLTPEDPYEVWDGAYGPIRVVPLFLLYDYSFGSAISASRSEALRLAYEAGVVCDDEFLLHPDPYPTREAWCEARVEQTVARLESIGPPLPTVLVNHFPLRVEATHALRRPEFAQWCGTVRTSDWHRKFRAAAVVYGHLHIRRTMWHDGVPFEEVSLVNPREWRRRDPAEILPRRVLPR